MTDPYLLQFADKAKTMPVEKFAAAAQRDDEAFYRAVWSIHFFTPGMTWAQAEQRVRDLIIKYPKN